MSAASEVDFIANVETEADRADVAFETRARVENAGEIIRAEIFDGAYRGSDGGRTIVKKEVIEAPLHGEEGMKATMAQFEFGAEETMENADVGAHYGNGWRNGGVVGETFRKNPVEVVAHFGFEHDGFVGVEAETGAQTGEIAFRLREAKIVGVNAGLKVIILGEGSWRESNDEQK
jgi:hypothetical protein